MSRFYTPERDPFCSPREHNYDQVVEETIQNPAPQPGGSASTPYPFVHRRVEGIMCSKCGHVTYPELKEKKEEKER